MIEQTGLQSVSQFAATPSPHNIAPARSKAHNTFRPFPAKVLHVVPSVPLSLGGTLKFHRRIYRKTDDG